MSSGARTTVLWQLSILHGMSPDRPGSVDVASFMEARWNRIMHVEGV